MGHPEIGGTSKIIQFDTNRVGGLSRAQDLGHG
jgi:hypothetical protein